MGLASVTLGLSTEAHEEQRELGTASFYWGGRVCVCVCPPCLVVILQGYD